MARPQMPMEANMAWNPQIDADKCVGCGECVDVCPVEVYEMCDGKSVPVNGPECIGCQSCVGVCPVSAICVEDD